MAKNKNFIKYYYAYGGLNYNPENDLLYLEVTESQPLDILDFRKEIFESGVLETYEMYRSRYKSSQDMPVNVVYQDKKLRDQKFDITEL